MEPKAYALQITAPTKAKAKKAIEERIAKEGAGCTGAAAVAAASAIIDAMPAPGPGEEILVVVSGVAKGDGSRQTEESLGCSVYIVPKAEEVFEEPVSAEKLLPGEIAGASGGAPASGGIKA